MDVRKEPLIGLIGKAGAGKDTVAARLVKRHGYIRVGFADALKAVMYDVDPVLDDIPGALPPYGRRLSDVVDREGWEAAKSIPEVRRLLQAAGVAIREHVGADVWRDAAMRRVDAHPSRPVVLSDTRFPNEAQAIRDRGGVLVRIDRPGAGAGEHAGHVSETALDDCPVDYVLPNYSTIEHLYERVDLLATWAARPRRAALDDMWRAAIRGTLADPRGGL